MEEFTYRFFRNLFSTKVYRPTGPEKRPLVEHALTSQRQNYLKIISDMFTLAASQKIPRGPKDIARSMPQVCITYIDSVFSNNPIAIFGADSEIHITGTIPILINIEGIDSLEFARLKDTDDIAACFPAALFCETSRSGVIPGGGNKLPFEVEKQISSYIAWNAIETAQTQQVSLMGEEHKNLDIHAQLLTKSIFEKFQEAEKNINEKAGALETSIEALVQRADHGLTSTDDAVRKAATFESQIIDLAKRTDELNVAIDAKIADAGDKIDGFLLAAKARSTYENLKIHWVDRAGSAQLATWVSWGCLLILLIVAPAVAIYENELVIRLIGKISDAAHIDVPPEAGALAQTLAIISRLVVITIPLALYFWLIRLVIRFNMRSMLLMDDARLRATIIETYYKMIEENAATVEDRALILQALCRPAPGHGGDSVDPPNFTELIDKAMGK